MIHKSNWNFSDIIYQIHTQKDDIDINMNIYKYEIYT